MNRLILSAASALLLLLSLCTSNVLMAQDCMNIYSANLGGGLLGLKGEMAEGDRISQGDTVTHNGSGIAELKVGEAGTIRLAPNSKVSFDVVYCEGATGTVRVRLLSGALWAKGNGTGTKLEISTPLYNAQVGSSTIAARAAYLDTNYTIIKGSEKIATRDWSKTVDVESYTFPFKGETAKIFALKGNVLVLPWGGRGQMIREGQQATLGYDESFISSKPTEIESSELFFTNDGERLASTN